MIHEPWCRSHSPEGFCNCKPRPDPKDAWHNATAEQIFKSLIPGWKGDK